MKTTLPISSKYDSAIFDALAIQIVLGLIGYLNLDGGVIAQPLGIALVAFWGGAVVLICRRPQTPTAVDIELLRFGYLLVIPLTILVAGLVWHLRGVL